MSHNNRSGSPQEEKNILVTKGNDGPSSSNPYGSGGGLNNGGRTSSGWTFGLGGGSGGGFSGGFGGSSRKRSRKRAQAVARAKAEQQAQAEAAARQIAQQQAEAAARQIAQQQAEATARQIAQLEAEAAARRVVQEHAEAAAQLVRQQAAEASRKLEVRAVAEARAQASLAALVAAPAITPVSAAAAKAFETAIKLAVLRFLASSVPVLVAAVAAGFPSDLANGELRPSDSSTPPAPPGIDSLGPTTLPAASPFPSSYPGGEAVPNPTQNETLPGVDPADANASIPGFPADDELPSPDVMFKDRRDDPGVANGYGKSVSGTWLGDATRNTGASIPSQIADQLRGREFANFHRFKEAFWKAVAQDPQLSKRMNRINLRQLQAGKPPFALIMDQTGGRVKLELHHKDPIAQGGAVYHMDNLVVLTPKRHIELHKEEN